jgi:hypothetical protein
MDRIRIKTTIDHSCLCSRDYTHTHDNDVHDHPNDPSADVSFAMSNDKPRIERRAARFSLGLRARAC